MHNNGKNPINSAESTVLQSAELHFVMDNLPLAIGFVDTVLRLRYANQQMMQLLAIDAEQLHTGLASILDQSAYEKIHPSLERALRFSESADYEGALYFDSETRYVRVRMIPAPFESVAAGGALLVIDDLTQQNRAIEKLVRSETALKQAQEISHIGSWEWHIATNRLVWSDEMHRIFGIDKEDFSGDPADIIQQAIHPDDREAVEEVNRSIIEGNRSVSVEYRIILPDGSVRTVWAESGQLIVDAEGRPAILTGIIQDITERTRAEAELLLKSAALEAAANGIIITEPDGTIVWVNAAFTTLTGYTKEEVIGLNPRDTVRSGMHGPEFYTELWDSISSGQIWQGELVNRRKDGSCYIEEQTITPIRKPDGSIGHYVGIKQDISERKALQIAQEEDLKTIDEMQHFLAATLHAFPANTAVLNNDGTIINVNNRWRQFARDNESEADDQYLGTNYLLVCENVEGADASVALQAADGIRAVIAGTQERFYLEYPCHSPATQRWFGMSVSAFDEPAPRRVVVAHIDITERKIAEQKAEEQQRFDIALRDSLEALTSSLDIEQVMTKILDNTAIVVPHDTVRIIEFEGNSAKASYLRGFTPEEEAFFADFRYTEPFPYHLNQVLQKRSCLIQDAWEDPNWAEMRGVSSVRSVIGVPIMMKNGILGTLAVGSNEPNFYTTRDVERLSAFARYAALAIENASDTARLTRKVDERTKALQASRDRVEAILDSVTNAVVLVDSDFNIQQTNASFNAMFGCEKDQCLHLPLSVLLIDRGGEVFSQILHAGSAKKRIMMDVEALRRDGTVFEAELNLDYIANDGCVCTFHDIGARKANERSLQKSIQMEKDLNQLKSRFVSMASHEFRTPLTVILSTAETLKVYRRRMTDEVIDQKLETVLGQVARLRDIVDDVLHLSRLQSRRYEFKPMTLDIDGVIRSIIEEHRPEWEGRNTLVYRASRSPLPIEGDEKLLRQLIDNLLSNAIKYSPVQKSISLSLDTDNGDFIFSVSDEGIGIPEEDQAHLFEAFHRAANVGAIPGTGLGLVILKEVVDLHGGCIDVKSTVDVGTTFTVRIPGRQIQQSSGYRE